MDLRTLYRVPRFLVIPPAQMSAGFFFGASAGQPSSSIDPITEGDVSYSRRSELSGNWEVRRASHWFVVVLPCS
jgi:hypothetical protein